MSSWARENSVVSTVSSCMKGIGRPMPNLRLSIAPAISRVKLDPDEGMAGVIRRRR